MKEHNIYNQHFLEALDRTSRFDLSIPRVEMTENRYINDQTIEEFSHFAQNIFGNYLPQEVANQCLKINMVHLNAIASFFDCRAYFTIGYIKDPAKCYFKATEQELYRHIESSTPKQSYNIHAWITLDSYEIIDLTFATSWGLANNHNDAIGRVTLTHPENLKKGRRYIPMLIGEEYLLFIGAITFQK